MSNKTLSPDQTTKLLKTLKSRFEKKGPKSVSWAKVEEKLTQNPKKIWSLSEMENTGGEPALVDYNKKTDEYIFFDCAPESPKGRRSLCYDRKALDSRKEHKPNDNVLDVAEAIGIDLLTEDEYRWLQELGEFDLKTSSWIQTPESIRKLGGALFCDRRYNNVFTYHNGAESYYAARGFRGKLIV